MPESMTPVQEVAMYLQREKIRSAIQKRQSVLLKKLKFHYKIPVAGTVAGKETINRDISE